VNKHIFLHICSLYNSWILLLDQTLFQSEYYLCTFFIPLALLVIIFLLVPDFCQLCIPFTLLKTRLICYVLYMNFPYAWKILINMLLTFNPLKMGPLDTCFSFPSLSELTQLLKYISYFAWSTLTL
jgi:hypothetical protein